jgi:hypothetical protein
VAVEEPKIGPDFEFRGQNALPVGSSVFIDMRDAVEHQHRGRWQTRIGRTEHLATGTSEKLTTI